MAAADKPKVFYFDAPGLASVTRLLYVINDVDFDDVRFTPEEWTNTYRAVAPLGMAPFLEEGGVKLGGTLAITRYVAEKYGMGGSNAMENAQLESYADAIKDVGGKLYQIKIAPEDKKDECKAEFLKNMPGRFAFLEKQVKGKDSFLDGKMSWPDIMVYTFNGRLEVSGMNEVLKDCPKLRAIAAKIAAIDKVKAYCAKHPPKP